MENASPEVLSANPDILERLSKLTTYSGIGTATMTVGDLVWKAGGGVVLVDRYGTPVSAGASTKGPLFTATGAGRVIVVAGAGMTVVGVALDINASIDAFSRGDNYGGTTSAVSAAGGAAGLVFWPAAVGTAAGSGAVLIINYYGQQHINQLDVDGRAAQMRIDLQTYQKALEMYRNTQPPASPGGGGPP